MLYNSSSLLENVTIEDNAAVLGAGLFAFQSTEHPARLHHPQTTCRWSDNSSQQPRGGGLHVLDSDLTLEDCTVSGHDQVVDGGGIYAAGYNTTAALHLTGGAISGNAASAKGCGLYQAGGTLDMHRVTLTDNARRPRPPPSATAAASTSTAPPRSWTA